MKRFRRAALAYLLLFASIPLLWEAFIHFSHLPGVVLPPPSKVWDVLRDEPGILAYNTGVTMEEALLGYAVANLLALVLALGFIWFPSTEAFVAPWTVMIKNIPYVTIAGILLITLGDNLAPKLLIVVLVCFFPLLANLVKGFRAADSVLIDRLAALNATRGQVFRKVLWPSALPFYLAAHETSFTGSIVGAIIAEWFFSRKGLGYLVVQAMSDYRGDVLYAVNLIAGALALAAYFSCKLLERWLFRWQRPR
jgi:NitT/TauT family transport system permease protein